MIFKTENQFQALFYIPNLKPKNYWTGTVLSFSGQNAAYFYKAIKTKKVDWDRFDQPSINLGRFDLYYFRKPKSADQNDLLELFMEESCQKIHAKSKRRHASWSQNLKGLILRIGSRQSSNYCRVYQKNNGLEFELEMKKEVVKSVQEFLFSDCIEEFEDTLAKHFYRQYSRSVVLDFCYIDWLLIWLRKTFQNQKPSNSLVTSYLKNNNLNSFLEKERFLKLLQFLSFIQTLKDSKQSIDDQVYYVIEFLVVDFIGFTGGNEKSTYQRTKALEFLKSLQNRKPLLQKFSDSSFRSSIMFPYLKIEKEGKAWIVTMAIGEEIYFYQYPFFFPSSFLTYHSKYDLEVKLQLIGSISF